MKKVCSFSVIIMLGYSSLAQDSLSVNRKDTMHSKMDSTMPATLPKDKMDTTTLSGVNGSTMNSGSDSTDTSAKVSTGSSSQTLSATTSVTTDTTVKVSVSDRVIMKDGKVYLVKNNEPALLEKSYKLESGAIVSTTGMVKYPSGKSAQLKNGQFIELKKIVIADVKKKTENKKSTVSVKKKTVQ